MPCHGDSFYRLLLSLNPALALRYARVLEDWRRRTQRAAWVKVPPASAKIEENAKN